MTEHEKQRLIQCITCARDPETCGCTEANEDETGMCMEWREESKCRDCKWCETFYHGPGSKWGTFSSFCMFKCKNINADDPFCYDGKRKEENNERKAV